jgi:hypothetical protein
MHFAFAWEFPAAVIGAVSVMLAAGAAVWAVARSSHGPSHGELLALGLLAAVGLWSWDTRAAMAKRLFPDGSRAVEETVAQRILNYGECAAYVETSGKGQVDGTVCTLDVVSSAGRYVSVLPPRAAQEMPCDVLAVPMLRKWTFVAGALQDWCE